MKSEAEVTLQSSAYTPTVTPVVTGGDRGSGSGDACRWPEPGRGLPVQVDVFVVMPLVGRVPVPVVEVVKVVFVRDGPVPAAGAVLAEPVVPVRLGAAHWCRLPSHQDIGGLAVAVGSRWPGWPHLAAADPSTIPPSPVAGR